MTILFRLMNLVFRPVFWVLSGVLRLFDRLGGPWAPLAAASGLRAEITSGDTASQKSGLEEKSPSDSQTDARKRNKHLLLGAVGVLVVLGAGGLLAAVSGVVSTKASSGHWAVTEWFLKFAMERSIDTHSLGLAVPPLQAPGLVYKGARQYQTACSPCHGSPILQPPRVVQAMLPPPPPLPRNLRKWQPQELFTLVKHGIKMTGMPAWPTQRRDDEVWAMVAFLIALPGLSAEQYRQLANEPEASAAQRGSLEDLQGLDELDSLHPALIHGCDRCHGPEGRGDGEGAFPRLAGQKVDYLRNALQAYAQRQRASGIMEAAVADLTVRQMAQLATYYSRQTASAPWAVSLSATGPTAASGASLPLESEAPATDASGAATPVPTSGPEASVPRGTPTAPAAGSSPDPSSNESALLRGQSIALHGVPAKRIPACMDCHGPTTTPLHAAYPVLAGQHADYLLQQLELFRTHLRGGGPYGHLMLPIVEHLETQQMAEVALYYQSLGSQPPLEASPGPNPAQTGTASEAKPSAATPEAGQTVAAPGSAETEATAEPVQAEPLPAEVSPQPAPVPTGAP